MTWGKAIEKGKEVEKMKRRAFLLAIAVAGLLLAPGHGRGAEPRTPVIVALGDSLTAGLGLPQDQSFPAQLEAALKARGLGPITTEILPAPEFYFAEDYHQQYLAKNPHGYCGIGGTGVSCPIGTGVSA